MKDYLILGGALVVGWLLISRPMSKAEAARSSRGAVCEDADFSGGRWRRCLVRLVGAGDALRRRLLKLAACKRCGRRS